MTSQNTNGNLPGSAPQQTHIFLQCHTEPEPAFLIGFSICNEYLFEQFYRIDASATIFRDALGLYHAQPTFGLPKFVRKLEIIRLNPVNITYAGLKSKIESLFAVQDRTTLAEAWFTRVLTVKEIIVSWGSGPGADGSAFPVGDDNAAKELRKMEVKRGFVDTIQVLYDCL